MLVSARRMAEIQGADPTNLDDLPGVETDLRELKALPEETEEAYTEARLAADD